MSPREVNLRRLLKYGFRFAVLCGVAGLLLGLTLPEGDYSAGHGPVRSYVAAVLAIIGVVGGGIIVLISFLLNILYLGRRARRDRATTPSRR